MNTLQLISLSLLLTGQVLLADPAAVVSVPAADPIAEALPILQAGYPDFPALHYQPGEKLEDLIARSNGGISLVAPDAPPPTPIITTTLPDGSVYWRLASFTPKKDWAELGTELQNDSQNGANGGAVLDLRSNEAPEDMRGASQIMSFFVPGDTSLKRYHLKNVEGNHLVADDLTVDTHFHGPLVVLTNQRTTGAAEVLAASLKADGALVVGAQTAGKGASFSEWKLSSGKILRFVAEHVRLADGSDLWGHPVVPDIALTEDEHTEKAALMLIRDDHILDVIQESAERHRMSEASLVQGQDPEWDEYLASLEKGPVLLSLPSIHDIVLISALDSLKAIQFSQRPAPAQATASASPPATTSIQ